MILGRKFDGNPAGVAVIHDIDYDGDICDGKMIDGTGDAYSDNVDVGDVDNAPDVIQPFTIPPTIVPPVPSRTLESRGSIADSGWRDACKLLSCTFSRQSPETCGYQRGGRVPFQLFQHLTPSMTFGPGFVSPFASPVIPPTQLSIPTGDIYLQSTLLRSSDDAILSSPAFRAPDGSRLNFRYLIRGPAVLLLCQYSAESGKQERCQQLKDNGRPDSPWSTASVPLISSSRPSRLSLVMMKQASSPDSFAQVGLDDISLQSSQSSLSC